MPCNNILVLPDLSRLKRDDVIITQSIGTSETEGNFPCLCTAPANVGT